MEKDLKEVEEFLKLSLEEYKKRVINNSIESADPNKGVAMQFFFFGEKGELVCFGDDHIIGKYNHPTLTEKQILILLTRLISISMPAKRIIHISESWMARKCVCGKDYTLKEAQSEDWVCPNCNSGYVPPSQNPYREEYVMASIITHNEEKNCVMYSSKIIRDHEEHIIGLEKEESLCEPMTAKGNFVDYWTVYPEFAPHFIINYPKFRTQFGHTVTEKEAQLVEIVRTNKPEDYQLIEFFPADLRYVKDMMNVN